MGTGAESEKGKTVKHHTTLQLTVYDGPARVGGLWEPEARRGYVSGLLVLGVFRVWRGEGHWMLRFGQTCMLISLAGG
jgi:hypothetical protein